MDSQTPRSIAIRPAQGADEPWIQSRYAELGFLPSDFERELVLIAIRGAERTGVGRLVPLGGQDAELGGIFVVEPFRRMGIADRIVSRLLEEGQRYRRVYCLPFAPLAPFYGRHGFREICAGELSPPDSILRKHVWCQRNYSEKTLLMVHDSSTDSARGPTPA